MKTLKVNPGAKRLIESLRNMGYDCSTAIADVVDNSIVANASEVYIDIISGRKSQPAAIYIADNGEGMDRNDLQEAMRFGAHKDYLSDDLGKYGLGLKTASLSQCRTLTVSSKSKRGHDDRPRRLYMKWDLDHIYKTNDWDLLAPIDKELESWEFEILNHKVAQETGTVVLWTSLDEMMPSLSSSDPREQEKFLASLIKEVSNHLGMVFHRFMMGSVTGRRKLNIYVCSEKLKPWDPFCRNEDTRELDIIPLPIVCVDPDGLKVKDTIKISPFILPREDEFSNPAAWKEASGPKNWNQQQGFYFYRNNRLLQAGGWSHLRTVDEHTKLLRVAVDFSRNLDQSFSINITKMRARIPVEVREKVASHVAIWVKKAMERYGSARIKKQHAKKLLQPIILPDTKGQQKIRETTFVVIGPLVFLRNDTPGNTVTIVEDLKNEQIKILIPRSHYASEIFSLKEDNVAAFRKFCLALLCMLEAVYGKKIKTSHIPLAALKKSYKNRL